MLQNSRDQLMISECNVIVISYCMLTGFSFYLYSRFELSDTKLKLAVRFNVLLQSCCQLRVSNNTC